MDSCEAYVGGSTWGSAIENLLGYYAQYVMAFHQLFWLVVLYVVHVYFSRDWMSYDYDGSICLDSFHLFDDDGDQNLNDDLNAYPAGHYVFCLGRCDDPYDGIDGGGLYPY